MNFELALIIAGIIAAVIVGFYLGSRYGFFKAAKQAKDDLPKIRQDAIKKSRHVISGLMSEQIAPYFPDFPYNPTEIRFIGKPIDFIVFKGMDNKQIEEVIFVEVKSGKAKINNHEKNLKEAIENKKVRWEEYRLN